MANTFSDTKIADGLSAPILFYPWPRPRPPQIEAFSGIPLRVAEQTFLARMVEWMIGSGFFDGPSASGSANGWTLTDSGTGTGAVAWATDGTITLTSGTTDEDFSQLQNLKKAFLYSTTRKLWAFARLKVSTATTTDALFGLAPSDTSLIANSAVSNTDGIYFFKAATATDFTFHVRASSTSTTQAAGLTITSDVYFVIGFVVENGVIRIYAEADPSNLVRERGFSTAPIAVANTNAPSVALYPSLLVGQEGGTTARVLTIDWAFICEQRA